MKAPEFDIIGISGKAETGKDYITAHYLRPLGYHNFSLAWHFKVGIVGEGKATHDEVFITKPSHVRKSLQLKGTEEGRNVFGENVWCNHVKEWLGIIHEHWGINKFVIPDIRFPNEVKFVQDLGGKVFRIVAPKRMLSSKLTIEQRLHPSEISLDKWLNFDGYIYNDPEYSETVNKQMHSLLGTELETSEETSFFENFMDLFSRKNNE